MSESERSAMAASPKPATPASPPELTETSYAGVGVVVRVRPPTTVERADPTVHHCVQCLKDCVVIGAPASTGKATSSSAQLGAALPKPASTGARPQQFQVDQVFHPHSSQIEVYEESCRHIVEGLFQGINGSILAYGATGSGKTHTMFGGAMSAAGIVYQAVQDIFAEKNRLEEEEEKSVTLRCSFVEIYNEEVFDLLATTTTSTASPSPEEEYISTGNASASPKTAKLKNNGGTSTGSSNPGSSGNGTSTSTASSSSAATAAAARNKWRAPPKPTRTPLQVRDLAKEDRDRLTNPESLTVVGLRYVYPESVDEFARYIELGHTNRFVAATGANAQSSRSHAIITVEVVVSGTTTGGNEGTVARVRFCDLAGSERAAATSNSGLRLREGGNINRSLLALGAVVQSLVQKKRHPGKHVFIPYRGSKLTRLLRDGIGGNCRTQMLFCLSPTTRQYEESVNTMLFAMQAKEIRVSAKRNEYNVNTAMLAKGQEQVIEELRAELAAARNELMRLGTLLPMSFHVHHMSSTGPGGISGHEPSSAITRASVAGPGAPHGSGQSVDSLSVVTVSPLTSARGSSAALDPVALAAAAQSFSSRHNNPSTPYALDASSGDSGNGKKRGDAVGGRSPGSTGDSTGSSPAVPPARRVSLQLPKSTYGGTGNSEDTVLSPTTITPATDPTSPAPVVFTTTPPMLTGFSAVSPSRQQVPVTSPIFPGSSGEFEGSGNPLLANSAPPALVSGSVGVGAGGSRSSTMTTSGASLSAPRPTRPSVFQEGTRVFSELESKLKSFTVEKESLYHQMRDAEEEQQDRDIKLREHKWKLAQFLASNAMNNRARGLRGGSAEVTSGGTPVTPIGVAGLRRIIAELEAETESQDERMLELSMQLDDLDRQIASVRQNLLREKQQASLELLLDNAKLRQNCTEAECLAAHYHQQCRTVVNREGEYAQALQACVGALRSAMPMLPFTSAPLEQAKLALLYANMPMAPTEEMLRVFETSLRAEATPPLAPHAGTSSSPHPRERGETGVAAAGVASQLPPMVPSSPKKVSADAGGYSTPPRLNTASLYESGGGGGSGTDGVDLEQHYRELVEAASCFKNLSPSSGRGRRNHTPTRSRNEDEWEEELARMQTENSHALAADMSARDRPGDRSEAAVSFAPTMASTSNGNDSVEDEPASSRAREQNSNEDSDTDTDPFGGTNSGRRNHHHSGDASSPTKTPKAQCTRVNTSNLGESARTHRLAPPPRSASNGQKRNAVSARGNSSGGGGKNRKPSPYVRTFSTSSFRPKEAGKGNGSGGGKGVKDTMPRRGRQTPSLARDAFQRTHTVPNIRTERTGFGSARKKTEGNYSNGRQDPNKGSSSWGDANSLADTSVSSLPRSASKNRSPKRLRSASATDKFYRVKTDTSIPSLLPKSTHDPSSSHGTNGDKKRQNKGKKRSNGNETSAGSPVARGRPRPQPSTPNSGKKRTCDEPTHCPVITPLPKSQRPHIFVRSNTAFALRAGQAAAGGPVSNGNAGTGAMNTSFTMSATPRAAALPGNANTNSNGNSSASPGRKAPAKHKKRAGKGDRKSGSGSGSGTAASHSSGRPSDPALAATNGHTNTSLTDSASNAPSSSRSNEPMEGYEPRSIGDRNGDARVGAEESSVARSHEWSAAPFLASPISPIADEVSSDEDGDSSAIPAGGENRPELSGRTTAIAGEAAPLPSCSPRPLFAPTVATTLAARYNNHNTSSNGVGVSVTASGGGESVLSSLAATPHTSRRHGRKASTVSTLTSGAASQSGDDDLLVSRSTCPSFIMGDG